MSLNVKNYVYTAKSIAVPRINISLNTITSDELEIAKIEHLEDVDEYFDNVKPLVEQKEYILDRFKKDALVEVGFATIDLDGNTYTENTYASKYWDQAVDGLDLTRQNNLTAAITNITELYQLFLNNSNEQFDNTTKEAVDYDIRAIEFSGTKFILTVPNATGTNRVYENNGDVLSYSKVTNKWVINDSNGDMIASCDDIDAAEPNWTIVNESSSSDFVEESSESSEEPVEESSSSEIEETSSESSEEPVEESSESSEIVEESSESSEVTEPETSSDSSEEPVEESSESSEIEEPVEESSESSEEPVESSTSSEEPVEESSESSEVTEPETSSDSSEEPVEESSGSGEPVE